MGSNIDLDIVNGIKNKNPIALELLNSHYGKILYGVVCKSLELEHEKNERDDCFNEILYAIWNGIKYYDSDKGKLVNYLISIAKFKAIDFKRKLKKRNSEMEFKPEILDEKNMYEEIGIDDKGELGEVLDKLDVEEKQIIVKRYFLDETVDKIAQDMMLSKDTVYKRLSLTRKKIKNMLGGVRVG